MGNAAYNQKLSHYQATGFYLLSNLTPDALIWKPVTAATKIEKGLAVFDDTAGFAYDTGTDLAATFLGIALAEADNTSGAAGAIKVPIIKPLSHLSFSVPVETAVIAQTSIGIAIDLGGTNGYVLVSDTVTGNWGFFVDNIDISDEAIAANAYGYAIGHFQMFSTT